MLDWWEEVLHVKVVWRSAETMRGVLCVMMAGTALVQELCVGS